MDPCTETIRIRTILVGVDGSPESAHAAAFAASLAGLVGARVIAAHATGLLDVWPGDEESPGTHLRNSHAHVNECMHGSWTDAIRWQGIRPDIVLRDGAPHDVLLHLADEFDVDLVVVGTRGVGRADPYGLGSVATRVAHDSARPVVVVPADARARPGSRSQVP